ncbi:MAG: 2-C-methyl-D-erythritol 4-phosphate cytidylyltransferase [Vicingaceae bacterium]
MKQSVIIVAGGKGSRMGTDTPKQFLPLQGEPILFHTLRRFQKALPQAELILVLPQVEKARWQIMAHGTSFANLRVVAGGAERFDSVKAGLAAVSEGMVGIHDSVRPLVSEKCILEAFEIAANKGSAIPVVEMKDSLREIEGQNSHARDRKKYCLVQTPQCFDVEKLKAAYQQSYQPTFTDDASVYEAAGNSVYLVAGNPENIKITTPTDLVIAEALLKLI